MATRFDPAGNFQTEAAPLVNAALFRAAAKGAMFMAARCPVGKGDQAKHTPTRDTIRAVPGDGMAFITVGGAGVFVELGTAPHSIDPVNAPVLAFEGSDGTMVFTAHVDHPGTAPQPFMRPGLADLAAWVSGGGAL